MSKYFQAKSEYEEACIPLWKKFEESTADIREKYKDIKAEYEKAIEPYWLIYEKDQAEALAKFLLKTQ